jgi:hypothetical protein
MKATGYSLNTNLLREMREAKRMCDVSFDKLHESINKLYSKFEELPNNCADAVENRVQINQQTLTVSGIKDVINTWFEPSITSIMDEIKSLRQIGISQVNYNNNNNNNNDLTANNNTAFNILCYDGKFHLVEKQFIFPSYNLDIMWNLWFNGDLSKNIPPLRRLEHFKGDLNCTINNVDYTKKNLTNFSRTKTVINIMLEIAKSNEMVLLLDANDNADNNSLKNIYQYSYPLLLLRLYKNKIPKRQNDINIYTLYNKISKSGNETNNDADANNGNSDYDE